MQTAAMHTEQGDKSNTTPGNNKVEVKQHEGKKSAHESRVFQTV